MVQSLPQRTLAEVLLSAYCGWQSVDELESMTDKEAMAEVEVTLKRMFPDTYEAPLTYRVTRWKQASPAHSHA